MMKPNSLFDILKKFLKGFVLIQNIMIVTVIYEMDVSPKNKQEKCIPIVIC